MSENNSVAKISARILGGKYSPTSLTFALDVNGFPSVSVNVTEPKGDESVKAPVSGEVLKRIGQFQTRRLAGRSKPDFEVSADDGIGNSLSFSGYIAAPTLELTKFTTLDKLSAVGEVALLDALDLSIYGIGDNKAARQESSSSLKPIEAAKSGNVPEVFKEVTQVILENYESKLNSETRPVAKEMLRLQHEVNTSGPLDLWNEILDASEVKYESWDVAFKKSPPIAKSLSLGVLKALTAQSSGFWGKVQTMLTEFGMYYVPEFDGVGRFERNDKKVEEPEMELAVSLSGLTVLDGSSKILQPGGVVMMARGGGAAARKESSFSAETLRVIAYAPDPLQAGFMYRVPPPFWLLSEEGVPILDSETSNTSASGGGVGTNKKISLSLSEREKAIKEGAKFKEEVDTVSEGIMTELCEVIFKELQLSQSTATLTLPLNFSVNQYVGKRVRVKINEGAIPGSGGTFTAFVTGVSHGIDLSQGKNLNSSTNLRLTHSDYR
jgi:hypothetical protein